MKQAHIINGGEMRNRAKGELNHALADAAHRTLSAAFDVTTTHVADGYDAESEQSRFLASDLIVFQFPMFWFGPPSTLKAYIDTVYAYGLFFEGSKEYGTGGKLGGRDYMFSVTGNAPKQAFDNPQAPLLQGLGVDDLLMGLHKTQTYIGLSKQPTFIANDVVMNPDFDNLQEAYQAHLGRHILQSGIGRAV